MNVSQSSIALFWPTFCTFFSLHPCTPQLPLVAWGNKPAFRKASTEIAKEKQEQKISNSGYTIKKL